MVVIACKHEIPPIFPAENCLDCDAKLCKKPRPETGQLCLQTFGHDTEENEEDRTPHSNPHRLQLGTWE